MKKALLLALVIVLVACCLVVLVACSTVDRPDGIGGDGGYGVVFDGTNRKMVYFVSMDIKTKDVQAVLSSSQGKAKELGGRIDNQSVDGDGGKVDNAYVTFKIPTEKLDEFLAAVKGSGKVSNESMSCTDITSQYVNATARKTALLARKQRLEDMLNTEGITVADQLAITNEISSVDEEIHYIEIMLADFDSEVDYSTVRLYIYRSQVDVGAIVACVFLIPLFGGLIAAVCVLAVFFAKEKRKNRVLAAAVSEAIEEESEEVEETVECEETIGSEE